MTTILVVDETGGTQNVQSGVTSNDTSAPLLLRFQDELAAEGVGDAPVSAIEADTFSASRSTRQFRFGTMRPQPSHRRVWCW